MVAIQRRDNFQWVIPGGMIDPGEKTTTTLKREFIEEALNGKQGEWMTNKIFYPKKLISVPLQFEKLNDFSMKSV